MSDYHIKIRSENGSLTSSKSVSACFAGGKKGLWLVIVPHDDDLVLGCGLLVQAAIAEGIEVHVAVASDGSMGYCDAKDRDGIVEIRRKEMNISSADIGIPENRIHWFGFQDGALPAAQGTTPRADGSVHGLAWQMTKLMRELKPAVVLSPTPTDYHPDHRVVGSEVDIACFHASGEIWSQLGAPIDIPDRWDFAVYCPFADEPNVQLKSGKALFDKKLESIGRFKSQRQIKAMVENCRNSGAVEYYSARPFILYSPKNYEALFES